MADRPAAPGVARRATPAGLLADRSLTRPVRRRANGTTLDSRGR